MSTSKRNPIIGAFLQCFEKPAQNETEHCCHRPQGGNSDVKTPQKASTTALEASSCTQDLRDSLRVAADPATSTIPDPIPLVAEYKAKRLELGSVKDLGDEFVNHGGKIWFVGKIEAYTTDPTEREARGSTANPPVFSIHEADILVPICHAGQNRSQVMYRVLLDLKRELLERSTARTAPPGREAAEATQRGQGNVGRPQDDEREAQQLGVELPHGALSGFDPYVAFQDLSEDNFHRFIFSRLSDEDDVDRFHNDAFCKALGHRKARRHGQPQAEDPLNAYAADLNPSEVEGSFRKVEIARTKFRERSDKTLWAPDSRKRTTNTGREQEHEGPGQGQGQGRGRVVFVCFAGAAVVSMSRLLEIAKRSEGAETEQKLKDVCVIALPWGDPVTQACSKAAVMAANTHGDEEDARLRLTAQCYKQMYDTYRNLFVVQSS